MDLSNALTLASLPSDIIRTIVNSVEPEKAMLNYIGLISKTWNLLGVEQIKKLPPIEILTFTVRGSELEVNVTVDKNHTNHFAKLHPTCSIYCTIKVAQVGIKFMIPMTVTSISRIFDYTNHIEILETYLFDQNALCALQKAIGCVTIDQLELIWLNYDPEIRKIVDIILYKHQISKIISSIDIISNDDLREFIQTISKRVSIVIFVVGGEEFLSEESKRSWKLFAEEIQENKNLLALKICSGNKHASFCNINEPFFDTMAYFQNL